MNRDNSSNSIMDKEWVEGVQQLLKQTRVGFLASSGEKGPETTMAPYALYNGKILLHLSRLAKHRGNIERNPNIGMMICTPETTERSALALPRLSLQGCVSAVATEDLAVAEETYLQHIPDAKALFSFADFQLFQFMPAGIHWIGGFGKARKISLQQWQLLSEMRKGESPSVN